jgi:excisionase family DNA binding protein
LPGANLIQDFELPSREVVEQAEVALADVRATVNAVPAATAATPVEIRVDLPAFAARLLIETLTALAEGHAVTVVPVPAELTTQQAADMLNVSRPYLIKLLDERKLPYRRVGNRRKVLLEDLLRYKRRDDRLRQDVLDELSREAQAIGLEY